jgi:hypothetical protein
VPRRRGTVVGEDGVAAQEVGVLGRVDVVGDDGEVVLAAEGAAQRRGQGRLPGADRPAEAHAQRPAVPVPVLVRVDVVVQVVVRRHVDSR